MITDFIDWRYIHSLVCIFDPACERLPPWIKELYLCAVAPLLTFPPPLSKLNVQYIQTMCVWGGGGWIVLLTIFCRNFTLCFWPDSGPTKLLHHPKQNDQWRLKKGLVSLKFLRPWYIPTYLFTQGRGEGGRWTSEKVRGALVHKKGSKILLNTRTTTFRVGVFLDI